MTALISQYDRLVRALNSAAPAAIPSLARLVFLAVFFTYFWNSATLKLDGLFSPTAGAFGQIFPKAAEAAVFNLERATLLQKAVMVLGAWAEFALPLLIVAGLATRLAALGMIGFVIVQSLTDIYGHGLGGDAIGAWFDNVASATILSQRTLWIFLLVVLVLRGAGPISVDALVGRLRGRMAPAPG